jgi:DNA modification methylase
MSNKSFAPEYQRNENGWILFPSDANYRKEMFPVEVNRHQAKANIFLIQACVEYVSKPGDYLIDPFGGTGTLMVAALMQRDVMLIEISPKYHELQSLALDMLERFSPGVSEHIQLINRPVQLVLPIPNLADHMIFSPPYAAIMKSKGTDKLTTEKTDYDMAEYTFTSPLNIGLMNDWLWAQKMEEVYAKCFKTLKPGGSMTIIVKDHYKMQKNRERKRLPLSLPAVNACKKVGFTQDKNEWFKWFAPGSLYTNIYRARGWEVVDDEDIIVLRKP